MRPKPCLLAIHEKLQEMVASKLMLDWSPERISGWLKIQYPDDVSMEIHENTGDFDASIRRNRNYRAERWNTVEELCDRYLGGRPSEAALQVLRNAEQQRPEVRDFVERAFRLMADLEVRSTRFFTLRGTLLRSGRAGHFAWRLGRNRAALHAPGAA